MINLLKKYPYLIFIIGWITVEMAILLLKAYPPQIGEFLSINYKIQYGNGDEIYDYVLEMVYYHHMILACFLLIFPLGYFFTEKIRKVKFKIRFIIWPFLLSYLPILIFLVCDILFHQYMFIGLADFNDYKLIFNIHDHNFVIRFIINVFKPNYNYFLQVYVVLNVISLLILIVQIVKKWLKFN